MILHINLWEKNADNECWFRLKQYDKWYDNVYDWLEDHPNKDITFQIMMILKYS